MTSKQQGSLQKYLVGGIAGAGLLGTYLFASQTRRKDADHKEDEASEREEKYQSCERRLVDDCLSEEPYDVILVMGGGRPKNPQTPPVWVQNRLDAAARIYNHQYREADRKPAILAVNGLSSHVVCPLNDKGLPVRHSGAAAQYLVRKRGIEAENIFMETTSYDTIGGAFFSRVQFTEIRGWRRLLVVTCDWHVSRVKAVFDWIFSATHASSTRPYNITYLGLKDTGLNDYVLQARKAKEKRSLANVMELRGKYGTLIEIQDFLCMEHDMYSAKRLVADDWPSGGIGSISKDVKVSYGMSPNTTPDLKSGMGSLSPGNAAANTLGAWSILPRFGKK